MRGSGCGAPFRTRCEASCSARRCSPSWSGVLALVGSYRVVGWAPVPEGTTRALYLGRMIALLFCVGVFEELASRGIVFRLLEQGLGTWLAMAISALFFGFGHRGNPGATWVSSLAIAIEAGGLLAASYVATRSLWVPIGLHWAWNLFEGPMWGTPVSGIRGPGAGHRPSFHRSGARSPAAPSGPRPGLPTLVLGTALGVAFVVIAIRRQQIVTPGWMWWIAGRLRRERATLPDAAASAPATAVPPSTG